MNHFKPSVVLVDDHVLLRNGLANLIRSFGEYAVLFEARNGMDLMRQLRPCYTPDIVLLDINMPEMDGYDTALWLKCNFPDIKIIALSMYDADNSIIRMLKNGAKGYILKDSSPAELRKALDSVIRKGFYYSEMVTGKLIHTLSCLDGPGGSDSMEFTIEHVLGLNEREVEFLKLACTELTYKEIADQMFLSPRTIDGYRDSLFEKLNVRTRVGLVLYAMKNGIVHV
jgi:two-component system, NarL family, invasion response regulator UvrY